MVAVAVGCQVCDVAAERKNKERFEDFESFQRGRKRLLVCTDLGSRGLDTAEVNLVLNYDCPFSTTDYVHRAGRTGRARQTCTGVPEVITYITQNKEVMFAEKIKAAASKNAALEDIRQKQNSAKSRYKTDMEAYISEQKRLGNRQ